MSRRAPRPFSVALEDLRARLQPEGGLAVLQSAWQTAAGETLAAAATPASLRGGVLTLRCESAVWAQEIQLMAGELIERLADAAPSAQVDSIRCLVGDR